MRVCLKNQDTQVSKDQLVDCSADTSSSWERPTPHKVWLLTPPEEGLVAFFFYALITPFE